MIIEHTYNPSFPLNQFVDIIWVGKAAHLELKSNNHAALFTELIFNYGDQFQVLGQNIENFAGKHDHHIISGLKTAPFQTNVSGTYGNVGLILKPFCYGMLIKKFGTYAMDRISEILYEFVFKPDRPKFEAIERFLLALFEQKSVDSDLVKFENYISSQMLEKGALKDFSLSLSISQKSFIQKFKRHYLLTPGEYVKLKQVNYAIQLLQNNNAEKLVSVGLDAGFYDQSHFIRVFKKFCGVSPSEFLKIKNKPK